MHANVLLGHPRLTSSSSFSLAEGGETWDRGDRVWEVCDDGDIGWSKVVLSTKPPPPTIFSELSNLIPVIRSRFCLWVPSKGFLSLPPSLLSFPFFELDIIELNLWLVWFSIRLLPLFPLEVDVFCLWLDWLWCCVRPKSWKFSVYLVLDLLM